MKRITRMVLGLVLGAAVAAPVFAQGRHDERPHAEKKQEQAAETAGAPAKPGRHDEGPHGAPKATKKAAEKAKAPEESGRDGK